MIQKNINSEEKFKAVIENWWNNLNQTNLLVEYSNGLVTKKIFNEMMLSDTQQDTFSGTITQGPLTILNWSFKHTDAGVSQEVECKFVVIQKDGEEIKYTFFHNGNNETIRYTFKYLTNYLLDLVDSLMQ